MKTSIWESKIFTHLPLMFSMITFLGGVFLIFDISVKNIIDIIVTHKAVFFRNIPPSVEHHSILRKRNISISFEFYKITCI